MTLTPAPEKLTKIIREGKPADCIAVLSQCGAAERRVVSDLAVALFNEFIEAYFNNPSPASLRKPDAARVAVLATASLEQVVSCDWHVIPEPRLLIEVFDRFQPDWTDDWVERVLDDNPYIMRHIHWLWETGLCKRPRSDRFIHGLIATYSFLHWPVETSALRAIPALSDPRLATTPDKEAELVEDLWRFFEVKGRGQFSLGYLDLGSAWRENFVELCEAGQMPRSRLLDASLAALDRDFNQAEFRCFARLFTDLKPTPEELNVRQEKLLALLNAELQSTVSLAVKAIKQMNKAYPIPAAALIKALKPVFHSPGKGTAISAIQLMNDAVTREPSTRRTAIAAVLSGLHHNNLDVQETSFAALEEWCTDVSLETLLLLKDSVSTLPPAIFTRALTLCRKIEDDANQSIQ